MHEEAAVPDPTTLLTGLQMGESPRWHDGRLWLADWMASEVLAIGLDGGREVVARVSALPFSLAWMPSGSLRIVAGTEILHGTAAGALVAGPDLTGISAYPWNEIVIDGRGNTYVNSIGFDMMAGQDPAPGCIALVTPDGEVRRVAGDVEFPNGMVVTPDNGTLILAESYGRRLTAFDIGPDGSLTGRRVWADLGDGCPDGLCLDADGAVWYADVPNRCCVRVREGGEELDRIEVDRGCFSCTLGGDEGRTLFIVAAEWTGSGVAEGEPSGVVLTTEVATPGAGWP
jgi:sugar lactone lactonase YvrE